jgi:hypothetical protein
MTYFIKEIFGFILPQLGVIEMDGLDVGRGPTPAHQRERSHKTNLIHDVL